VLANQIELLYPTVWIVKNITSVTMVKTFLVNVDTDILPVVNIPTASTNTINLTVQNISVVFIKAKTLSLLLHIYVFFL